MAPPSFLVLLIAFVGSATRDETQVGADPLQLDFTATGKQHIWNKGFAAAGVIDSVGEVDTTPASQSSLMDSSREEGPDLSSGASGASQTLVSQPSDPYKSNGEGDSSPWPDKEIKGSPSKSYRYIEELGAGSFGRVWKAVQKDGAMVAIKTSAEKTDENTPGAYAAEYAALERCRGAEGSRYVVQMLDHFKDNGGRYYIVLEFAEAGDLDEALHGIAKPVPEKSIAPSIIFGRDTVAVWSIANSILSALEFLKRKKIAHLDLKPANVLLWKSGGQWTAKLTDFGLAVLNIDQKKTKSAGTGDYASPEVFRGNYTGPEVDVWAFGVLLYEMATGKRPYNFRKGEKDSISKRQNFERDHSHALARVPPELKDIITGTQQANIGDRFTIEQIRRSTWFQQEPRLPHQVYEVDEGDTYMQSWISMWQNLADTAQVDRVNGQVNEETFRRWFLASHHGSEDELGQQAGLAWAAMSDSGSLTWNTMKAYALQIRMQEGLQSNRSLDSRRSSTPSSSDLTSSLTPVPQTSELANISQWESYMRELFTSLTAWAKTDRITEQIFKDWARANNMPPKEAAGLWSDLEVRIGDVLTLEHCLGAARREDAMDQELKKLEPDFQPEAFERLCAEFEGLVEKYGRADGKREIRKENLKLAIQTRWGVDAKKSEEYYNIFDKSKRLKVNLVEYLKGVQAIEDTDALEKQEQAKATNLENSRRNILQHQQLRTRQKFSPAQAKAAREAAQTSRRPAGKQLSEMSRSSHGETLSKMSREGVL